MSRLWDLSCKDFGWVCYVMSKVECTLLIPSISTAIPGITEGNEVTDGKVSDSEMVKLHFERQRKARLLHLQADSENRIKQGIQARTSQYQDIVYKQGDEVFFDDKNGTRTGPVWVTHNGSLKKVAKCNVFPYTFDLTDSDDETNESEDSDEDNKSTEIHNDSIDKENEDVASENNNSPNEENDSVEIIELGGDETKQRRPIT